MTSLYNWLGSWRRVAYWWLTGSIADDWLVDLRDALRRQGHDAATSEARRQGRAEPEDQAPRTPNERSKAIAYTGTWRRARHGGYGGDAVALLDATGATATFAFTGTRSPGTARAGRPVARPRSTSTAGTSRP